MKPPEETENANDTKERRTIASTTDIDEKRFLRTQKELERLKMDVKGGDSFLTKKRTRRSLQTDQKFIYTELQTKKRSMASTPKSSNKTDEDLKTDAKNATVKKQYNLMKFLTDAPNSENQVIESSQESIVEVLPLNASKNPDEDSLTESEKAECRKDTESCNPDEVLEDVQCVLKLDVQKKNLTDSDREICDKDTESMSFIDELPSSPVTVETPTRVSELLLNTSDISPIRNVSSSPRPVIDEDETQVLFVPSAESEFTKQSNTREEEPATYTNLRSAKLLSLISGKTPLRVKTRSSVPQKLNVVSVASPKTDRIKKMMASLEQKKLDSDSGCSSKSTMSVDVDNLLKFERDVPSPLAVPAGGSILKRKKPDSFDENSPCPKVTLKFEFLATGLVWFRNDQFITF